MNSEVLQEDVAKQLDFIKYQEILASIKQALIDFGYSNVNMAELVKQSSINQDAVKKYINNKLTVVLSLLDHELLMLQQSIDSLIQADLPLAHYFYCDEVGKVLSSNTALLFGCLAHQKNTLPEKIQARIERYFDLLKNWFEQALPQEIKARKRKFLINFIIAQIQGASLIGYRNQQESFLKRVGREISRYLNSISPVDIVVMCCSCSAVKESLPNNHASRWVTPTDFVMKTLNVDVSHGYCPDCRDDFYQSFEINQVNTGRSNKRICR